MQHEIKKRLKTKILGREIHYYPTVGSTNSEAIQRARNGGNECEIFLADCQTAGRGRMGRSWDSPAGKNLYISFLLRPKKRPTEILPLTLLAAMVTHQTLTPYSPSPLKIKWPNDIMLGGKKVAGILTESSSLDNKVDWVVSGIGININAERDDFSPDIRNTATSLKIASGKNLDRVEIAVRLIESFEEAYLDFLKQEDIDAAGS